MPKKAKRETTEEIEVKLPEFNEGEFYRKEIMNAKRNLVSIGYAFVISLISAGFFKISMWLSIIVWFLSFSGIKFVWDFAKLTPPDINWKTYLGAFWWHFITWLAVMVLLLNPPVSDWSNPTINDYTAPSQELAPIGTPNSFIQISAKIMDNSRISEIMLTAEIDGKERQLNCTETAGHIYISTIPPELLESWGYGWNTSGDMRLNYTFKAKDEQGYLAEVSGSIRLFENQPPVITSQHINNSRVVISDDNNRFSFQIQDNCRLERVFYSFAPNTTVFLASPEKEGSSSYVFEFKGADLKSTNEFYLTAADRAGNIAVFHLTMYKQ
ncbi:MAG: hypothetical protein QW728_05810 [Thermoplasmata archaeon]